MNKGGGNIKQDRIFALLSYLWILCIVPLLLEKEDRFVLGHAKQGLVLFIAETIAFILKIFPFFSQHIWNMCLMIFTAVSLYGIFAALSGRPARILIVSGLAEKINI